jgi:outer membrane lipoprotein-sorting protein
MVKKHYFILLSLLLFVLFLSGCPKKVPEPELLKKPPVKNPMDQLMEAFSSAESLQARASIRIQTVRGGEEQGFLLNGILLYQRPDKLRLLGYLPFGMNLFDALYRNGEFLLFIPLQKRAYTGEVSQFEDLIDKAGTIQFSFEKSEGNDIPKRIQIEVMEKETRIELRLKEISINSTLPEESFEWTIPEGMEVIPLARLLKDKKLR